jgi:curved DNA-binding protein CbpA
MADLTVIDLYRVLGSKPDASPRELTLSYRQLARQLHPDRHVKVRTTWLMSLTSIPSSWWLPYHCIRQSPQADRTTQAKNAAMMSSISEAFSTLGDSARRQAYDAARRSTAAKASTAEQGAAADSMDLDELEWDGTDRVFFHSCRCGGMYRLRTEDMDDSGHIIIPCNGCSLLLGVEYDVDSESSAHTND